MKYAFKMDSGAMIYVPSFIKIGLGIQKLIGGDSQILKQCGDPISLILFFKKKESKLITNYKLC
jgi:hypothetical protein